MNWLLIIVGLFVIGNMAWGYWKGFLRVAYSMVEWILVLIIVVFATPYVSSFLTNHTKIPAKIEVACMDKLTETVQDTRKPISKENIQEALGVEIPDALMDRVMAATGITDQFPDTNDACRLAAHKLSEFATKGIAYVLTLIVATIIIKIGGMLLDIISKIPILSGANKICGIAAGLIKGMLLVWIVFAILPFCAATPAGTALITSIQESQILTWLYENNLLLTVLLRFF